LQAGGAWGNSTDISIGDWTSSDVSKIGVMRYPSVGVCTWYLDIRNKHTYDPSTVGTYAFGLPGNKAVPGPFAGKPSLDNIGTFRCRTPVGVCTWYVDNIGVTGSGTTLPVGVPAGATYSVRSALVFFAMSAVWACGSWIPTGIALSIPQRIES